MKFAHVEGEHGPVKAGLPRFDRLKCNRLHFRQLIFPTERKGVDRIVKRFGQLLKNP
nr:hypothetical protein [Hydrogenibacillus sp. N12]